MMLQMLEQLINQKASLMMLKVRIIWVQAISKNLYRERQLHWQKQKPRIKQHPKREKWVAFQETYRILSRSFHWKVKMPKQKRDSAKNHKNIWIHTKWAYICKTQSKSSLTDEKRNLWICSLISKFILFCLNNQFSIVSILPWKANTYCSENMHLWVPHNSTENAFCNK